MAGKVFESVRHRSIQQVFSHDTTNQLGGYDQHEGYLKSVGMQSRTNAEMLYFLLDPFRKKLMSEDAGFLEFPRELGPS